MKIDNPTIRFLFWLTFCLFTATCEYPEIRTLIQARYKERHDWQGRRYRSQGEYTDGYRELVEKWVPQGARLYYDVELQEGGLQPADRSTHLALSWAMSPVGVQFGSFDSIPSNTYVISSPYRKKRFPNGFKLDENKEAILWYVGEPYSNQAFLSPTPVQCVSPVSEGLGAGIVCFSILLFCVFALPKSCFLKNKKRLLMSITLSIGYFGLLLYLTLSHTYYAPTGLGVFGGKAKLLYLSGWFSKSFFVNPAFSSYQPAYPPGLAIFTWFAYQISGSCGEWLTQGIVVFALSSVLFLLLQSTHNTLLSLIWLTLCFLHPAVVTMGTFYYAEPFVVLCLLIGWIRVRANPADWLGWCIIGLCGWFKMEGILLVFATVLAWIIGILLNPDPSVQKQSHIKTILIRGGVSLFVSMPWHIYRTLQGGEVYHYASILSPNWGKCLLAGKAILKTVWWQPYGLIGGFIVAVLFVRIIQSIKQQSPHQKQMNTPFFVSLLSFGFCLIGFSYIYSLSLAPLFDWHVDTSVSRLVWMPLLIVLYEALAQPRRK